MSRLPAAPALLLALSCIAPSAGALPLAFGVSGGPVVASGEGASNFPKGVGLQAEAMSLSHGFGGNEWVARFAYADFGSPQGPALMFFNAGQLYSPVSTPRTPLRSTTLQAGLSHRFRTVASLRPRVEGLLGASWTEQLPSVVRSFNNRRPDPAAGTSARVIERLVPALSIGLDLEMVIVGRLGVNVGAAAQWIPVEHFNGVLLPIRAGASWSAAPAATATATAARDPMRSGAALRISSGVGFLGRPRSASRDMTPEAAFAAALEVPVIGTLALSLQGEHSAARAAVPAYRQEIDNFGNATNVLVGQAPRSLTVTAMTLGLRAARPLGSMTASARGGVGWARTGGFGETQVQELGLYVDPGGNLVPLTQSVDLGVGATAAGFAWSAAIGAEVRLLGSPSASWGKSGLAAFAEAGALGMSFEREDVLVLPVRLGLVLR